MKSMTLRGISLFVAIAFSMTTLISNPSAALAAMESLDFQQRLNFQKELQSYLYAMPSEMGTMIRTSGEGWRMEEGAPAFSPSALRHPSPEQFVVLIQDAHSNPEGQQNVAAMLKYLEEKFPELVVGLEGASGELHPEYLNFFKEFPAANRAVVEDLHQKGELNGAELFLLQKAQKRPETTDYRLQSKSMEASAPVLGLKSQVSGVEDTELYRDNLRTYRELLFKRDEMQTLLGPIRAQLEKESSQKLNGELRDFLKERSRRKEGKYALAGTTSDPNLQAYVRYLQKQSLKLLEIDLRDPIEQLRFASLLRVVKIEEAQKGFDPEKARRQWEGTVRVLKAAAKAKGEKEFVQAFASFGYEKGFISKTDRGAFSYPMARSLYPRKLLEGLYRFAQKHQLSFTDQDDFWQSWKFAVFQAEIDVTALLQEMKALEDGLIRKLARSEDEKALVRELENFDLLEKMLRLELSREEYDKVLEEREGIESLFEGPGTRDRRPEPLMKSPKSQVSSLESYCADALHFYAVSLQRDRALITNLLKMQGDGWRMEDGVKQRKGLSPSALRPPTSSLFVLYAGGFHTPGIEEILRQKGIGYAVFSPRITKTDHGEMYQKVMSDANSDLSAYFKVKNPFLTKQEALFFKQLIETAAPALSEKYQLSPDQVAKSVVQTVSSSSVFSGTLTADQQKENPSTVRFTPAASSEISTSQNSAIMKAAATMGRAEALQLDPRTDAGLGQSATDIDFSARAPAVLRAEIRPKADSFQTPITVQVAPYRQIKMWGEGKRLNIAIPGITVVPLDLQESSGMDKVIAVRLSVFVKVPAASSEDVFKAYRGDVSLAAKKIPALGKNKSIVFIPKTPKSAEVKDYENWQRVVISDNPVKVAIDLGKAIEIFVKARSEQRRPTKFEPVDPDTVKKMMDFMALIQRPFDSGIHFGLFLGVGEMLAGEPASILAAIRRGNSGEAQIRVRSLMERLNKRVVAMPLYFKNLRALAEKLAGMELIDPEYLETLQSSLRKKEEKARSEESSLKSQLGKSQYIKLSSATEERSELRERQVFEGDLTTEKTVRGHAVFLSEDKHDFQWAMAPGGESLAETEYETWFKIVHDGINELFLPPMARHLKIFIQKKREEAIKSKKTSSDPMLKTSHPIALVLGAVQDGVAKNDIKQLEKGSVEESLFLKYVEDMARIFKIQRQIVLRSGGSDEAEKIIKRQFSVALELMEENIAQKEEALDSQRRRLAFFPHAEQQLKDNEMILQEGREGPTPLDDEYREDLEEKNENWREILETKEEVVKAEGRHDLQKMVLKGLEKRLKQGVESELYLGKTDAEGNPLALGMKDGGSLPFVIYSYALKNFLSKIKKFDLETIEGAHGAQSNQDSGTVFRDIAMGLTERLELEMIGGVAPQEKNISIISDGTQRILFVRRPLSANEILREVSRYGADLVGIVATQSSASAHWVIVVRGRNSAPPILFLSEKKYKDMLNKIQLDEDVLLVPSDETVGRGVLKTNPSPEDLDKALRAKKEEDLLAQGERKIGQFPLGISVGVNLSTHDIGDPRASGADNSGLVRKDFLDDKTKREIEDVGQSIGSGDFKFDEWLTVLEKLNFSDMSSKVDIDSLMNNFVGVLTPEAVGRIRTLLGHLRTVDGRVLRDDFFEGGKYVPFRTLDLQPDSKNKDLLDALKRLHRQYPKAGLIQLSPEELKKDPLRNGVTGFDFYQHSNLGKFFLIWQVTALLIEYAQHLDSTDQKDPAKLAILFPMVASPEQLKFIQQEILPVARKLAVLNFERTDEWDTQSFLAVQAKVQKASDRVSYGMMVEVMDILKNESLMDSMVQNPFVEFYDIGTNDLEKELWESIVKAPVDRDVEEAQRLFGRLMPDLVMGLDRFARKLADYNMEAGRDPARKQKRMCVCGQMGGNQKFLALVERWRRLKVPVSVSVGPEDVSHVRHALLRYSRVSQSSLDEVFEVPNYIDRRAGKLAKSQMLISKKFLKVAEAWQERYARMGYYHGFYRDSLDPVTGIGSFRDILVMRDIYKLFGGKQPDLKGAGVAEEEDMTREEFEKLLNYEKGKSGLFDEQVCAALLSAYDFLKGVRQVYREMQVKDPQKFKEPFNLHTGNLNDFLEAYEGKFGKQEWLARTDAQQRQDQFFRHYYVMANHVYTSLTGMVHEGYEDLFGADYEDIGLVTVIQTERDSQHKEEAIPLRVQLRSGMFFKREVGHIYRKVKELYIPEAYERMAFERFSRNPALMLEVFSRAVVDGDEEVRISYDLQKIMRRAIRNAGPVSSGADEMLFKNLIKGFFALDHDISYPIWRMHRFGFFSKFLPDYDAMPNFFPGDGRRSSVHIQTLNAMEFLEKLFNTKDFAFLRAGLVLQQLKVDPQDLTTLRLSLLMLGIVRAKLRLKPGNVPAPADIKKIVAEALAAFGISGQSEQAELIAWLIEGERTLNRNDLSAPEKIRKALETIFLEEGKNITSKKWDMLYLLTFVMRAGRAEHEKLVMLKREGPDSSLANCDKLYLAGKVLTKISIPPQEFEQLVEKTQRLERDGLQELNQPVLMRLLTGEKADPEEEISKAWADFSRREADILAYYEQNEILPSKYREALHAEIDAMAHQRTVFKTMFLKYEKMVSRYYWKGLDPETLTQQLICCISLEVLQRHADHRPILLFNALPQHYSNAFEIVFGRVSEDPALLAIYSRILYQNDFSIETVNIQREKGEEGKFIVRFMGSFPRGKQDLKPVMTAMRKDLADILDAPGEAKENRPGWFEERVRRLYRLLGPYSELALFAANQRNNPLFFRNTFNRHGDLAVQRSGGTTPTTEVDFFEGGGRGNSSYNTLTISTEDRRGLTALVTNYLSLIRGLNISDFSFEDTLGKKTKMIVRLNHPRKETWQEALFFRIVGIFFFWKAPWKKSKDRLSEKEKTQIKEELTNMLDAFEAVIHRGHFLNTYALKINASGTVNPADVAEKSSEASSEPAPIEVEESTAEVMPKGAVTKAVDLPEIPTVGVDDPSAREYTIQGSLGLHAMPSQLLAKFAINQSFLDEVIFEQKGIPTDMKSVLSLLELGQLWGEPVVIRIKAKPEATPEQLQAFWTWIEELRDPGDPKNLLFFAPIKRSEVRVEEKQFSVGNRLGIHVRPAGVIVTLAEAYAGSLKIKITKKKVTVNAASMMGLLTLDAGKGAKVTITVEGPQEQAKEFWDKLALLEEGGESLFRSEIRGKGKILFVDDDPGIQMTVADSLAFVGGYEVEKAFSADEALEILKKGDFVPDLIISDFSMPGKTGGDLVKAIRLSANGIARIPVLMFTAAAAQMDIENLYREGQITGTVSKTSEPDKFHAQVEWILQNEQSVREILALAGEDVAAKVALDQEILQFMLHPNQSPRVLAKLLELGIREDVPRWQEVLGEVQIRLHRDIAKTQVARGRSEIRNFTDVFNSILIVDDRLANRYANVQILKARGFKGVIHQAASAAEARDIMKQQKVDVLILDRKMPGMLGTEFAREILRPSEKLGVSVVLFTAQKKEAEQELSGIGDRVVIVEKEGDDPVGKIVSALNQLANRSETREITNRQRIAHLMSYLVNNMTMPLVMATDRDAVSMESLKSSIGELVLLFRILDVKDMESRGEELFIPAGDDNENIIVHKKTIGLGGKTPGQIFKGESLEQLAAEVRFDWILEDFKPEILELRGWRDALAIKAAADLSATERRNIARMAEKILEKSQKTVARLSQTVTQVKKILVVDDDVANRALLENLLRRQGYTVVVATNGAEAIKKLEDEHDIDFLITDFHMPEKTGGDILQAMAEGKLSRKIPSALMSGGLSDSTVDLKLFWAEGVYVEFLQKPNLIKPLFEILKRFDGPGAAGVGPAKAAGSEASFSAEAVLRIKKMLELENRAGDVLEMYQKDVVEGRLPRAASLKQLLASFRDGAEKESNLYKSASWVLGEIGARSEMRESSNRQKIINLLRHSLSGRIQIFESAEDASFVSKEILRETVRETLVVFRVFDLELFKARGGQLFIPKDDPNVFAYQIPSAQTRDDGKGGREPVKVYQTSVFGAMEKGKTFSFLNSEDQAALYQLSEEVGFEKIRADFNPQVVKLEEFKKELSTTADIAPELRSRIKLLGKELLEKIDELSAPLAAEPRTITAVPKNKANLHILVVDDEDGMRTTTAKLLRNKGYVVSTAVNGKDALDKLRAGGIEGVVSDITMPEMDGIALTNAIIDEGINVFIFLVSGYSSTDLGLEGFAKKGKKVGFFQKPYSLSDLDKAIKEHVRSEVRGTEKIQKDIADLNGKIVAEMERMSLRVLGTKEMKRTSEGRSLYRTFDHMTRKTSRDRYVSLADLEFTQRDLALFVQNHARQVASEKAALDVLGRHLDNLITQRKKIEDLYKELGATRYAPVSTEADKQAALDYIQTAGTVWQIDLQRLIESVPEQQTHLRPLLESFTAPLKTWILKPGYVSLEKEQSPEYLVGILNRLHKYERTASGDLAEHHEAGTRDLITAPRRLEMFQLAEGLSYLIAASKNLKWAQSEFPFARAEVRVAGTAEYKESVRNTLPVVVDLPVGLEVVAAAEQLGVYSDRGIAAELEGGISEDNIKQARLWIAVKVLKAMGASDGQIMNERLRSFMDKVMASLPGHIKAVAGLEAAKGPQFHVYLEGLSEQDWSEFVRNFPVVLGMLVTLRGNLSINVKGGVEDVRLIQKKFDDLMTQEGITLAAGQLRIVPATSRNHFESFKGSEKADAFMARREDHLRARPRNVSSFWITQDQDRMETLAAGIATALLQVASDKPMDRNTLYSPSMFRDLLTNVMNAIQGYLQIQTAA